MACLWIFWNTKTVPSVRFWLLVWAVWSSVWIWLRAVCELIRQFLNCIGHLLNLLKQLLSHLNRELFFCFWLIVEGLRGAACPYFSLSHFPDNISHAHAFLFLRIIDEMRARPFLFLRIIEQMHAHTFSHSNNITHTMMCPETQHTHRGTEPLQKLQKRLSLPIAPIFRNNRFLEKLRN